MILKKVSVAALGLLLSTAAALPAKATMTFAFDFTAPLTNGDTATGFGTLKTQDADASGHYRFLSAKGTFDYGIWSPEETIIAAYGISGAFNFTDGFLYKDASDSFVTDSIFFRFDPFGGIAFTDPAAGLYGGFYTEVGVKNATLSFSPTAVSVPEPATWTMLILGFGALGWQLRRRRLRAGQPAAVTSTLTA